jgi:hypothetical protein
MLSTVGPDSICQQVAGAVAIGILITVAATADTGTIDSMVDGLTMSFIVCGAILRCRRYGGGKPYPACHPPHSHSSDGYFAGSDRFCASPAG